MILSQLFEKRTGPIDHATKHRRLYHLTDNYGLGISVETNTLKALRQDYISTTYRRETDSILGRHHYHYKFILDGRKLAKDFGVFPYDHHVIELGSGGSRESVSAGEAEVGINTSTIPNLSDYLVGVVILSRAYTEHQVLFLADINHNSRGSFDVEKTSTIHAITALNRLSVPIYWQEGEVFIPLTARDHEYLRDIEAMMQGIEANRTSRHLDIIDKLLDKYDIKTSDFSSHQSLDKQITYRRRMIPQMIATLNAYYKDRPLPEIKSSDLKLMLTKFLKLMKFGNNTISMVLGAAEDANFFHPVVEPVAWTGVLRNLVAGDIDAAIDDVRYEAPHPQKLRWYADGASPRAHALTGMSGDDNRG